MAQAAPAPMTAAPAIGFRQPAASQGSFQLRLAVPPSLVATTDAEAIASAAAAAASVRRAASVLENEPAAEPASAASEEEPPPSLVLEVELWRADLLSGVLEVDDKGKVLRADPVCPLGQAGAYVGEAADRRLGSTGLARRERG